jgi:catechol 2,3-dioxygenase-like lactoylglutathione lyase family enzyme
MSHVRRFDHVGLTVADLDVVTAFFVALGLEVEGRTFVEGGGSQRRTEMAGRYPATYPAAVKCLLAEREGQTAYLRFPAEHHHRIRHSNFIEGTFG